MVVGANGFLGRYLVSELSRAGGEVISVVLKPRDGDPKSTVACDVSDPIQAGRLLSAHSPDRVYFLAGSGRVGNFQDNEVYFRQNTLSLTRFLEAAEMHGRKFQLFFSSSMHVYGNPTTNVLETTPVKPETYYGFTKFLAEKTLEDFANRRPGCEFIVGRMYTCIGPGQPGGFVVPDLCQKIRKLAPGQRLAVLNPKGFRQFMDARDWAALLPLLWDAKGRTAFEYINIAQPRMSTIEEIARRLIEFSGTKVEIEAQPDSGNLFLGIRVPPDKLQRWIPQFQFRPLETTLKEVWDCR